MNLDQLHQQPGAYLVVAAFLLAIGIFGLMRRRTLVGMLISGEIIFFAAILNFMTVNRFFSPDPTSGQIFALFIMGLAAAEAAIALSIIIAVYRNYGSIQSKELTEMKG
jgi:NADH:ubiquinone oxidoreductase subunit K